MDRAGLVAEVMKALEDDTDEGRMWAELLVRYARNTSDGPMRMVRLLPGYSEELVLRAWKVAHGVSDGDAGAPVPR